MYETYDEKLYGLLKMIVDFKRTTHKAPTKDDVVAKRPLLISESEFHLPWAELEQNGWTRERPDGSLESTEDGREALRRWQEAQIQIGEKSKDLARYLLYQDPDSKGIEYKALPKGLVHHQFIRELDDYGLLEVAASDENIYSKIALNGAGRRVVKASFRLSSVPESSTEVRVVKERLEKAIADLGVLRSNLEEDIQAIIDARANVHLYNLRQKFEKQLSNMITAHGIPQPVFQRVTYYDPRYPSGHVTHEEGIQLFFKDRGFQVKNADELKAWMQEQTDNGTAHFTVVVFAHDVVPITVAEYPSSNCLIRHYLDAGGRVVWHGDIPFWRYAYSDGENVYSAEWGKQGPENILGILADAETVHWQSGLETITEEGKRWGLAIPAHADRPVSADTVDTILSTNQYGEASCWHKNFNPMYPYSGFVRHRAVTRPGGCDGHNKLVNAEFFRLAMAFWPPIRQETKVTYY
ncbi:MAG: hypothetical protein OEW09_05950 [Anaerolineae bacterium]|nr:hypothetical protein [Anaerolineae bacterium]